jgi:hypothetical protein
MKFFCALFFILIAINAHAQSLQKLVNKEMIGVQRLYFEKFTGVPKYISKNSFTYNVNNCEIRILTNSRNDITSIKLNEISNKCTVNISKSGFVFSEKNLIDLKVKDILNSAYEWTIDNNSCLSNRGTGQLILDQQFVIHAMMPGALGRVQVRFSTWGKEAINVSKIVEDMFPNAELCLYGDFKKEIAVDQVKKIIKKEMLESKVSSIEFFY